MSVTKEVSFIPSKLMHASGFIAILNIFTFELKRPSSVRHENWLPNHKEQFHFTANPPLLTSFSRIAQSPFSRTLLVHIHSHFFYLFFV